MDQAIRLYRVGTAVRASVSWTACPDNLIYITVYNDMLLAKLFVIVIVCVCVCVCLLILVKDPRDYKIELFNTYYAEYKLYYILKFCVFGEFLIRPKCSH